jgi:hypothetical protein
VTIVRVGLSENNKFATGYEAIFGKKKARATSKPARAKTKKTGKAKKK